MEVVASGFAGGSPQPNGALVPLPAPLAIRRKRSPASASSCPGIR